MYLKIRCVTSSLPREQDTSFRKGEIQNVQMDSIILLPALLERRNTQHHTYKYVVSTIISVYGLLRFFKDCTVYLCVQFKVINICGKEF